MNGGVQQTLPKNWKLSLNFGGWTRNTGLQSKSDGNYYYSMTAQKSFLNNRLNFYMYANSFFQMEKHSKRTVTGENFLNRTDSSYNPCRFGLSVSWRIGELSSGVKKAERSIENDDVKSKK